MSEKQAAVEEHTHRSLSDLLNKLSKEDLVKLLLEINEDNRLFGLQVKLRFSDGQDDVSLCRELIRTCFDAAGIYNFEIGADIEDAVTKVEIVLEKADVRRDEGNTELAMKIGLMVYQETYPLLQEVYNPEELEGFVDKTLKLIDTIAQEIANGKNEKLKKKVADDLMRTVNDFSDRGYDHDLNLPLMEVISHFGSDPAVRKKLEDKIHSELEDSGDFHFINENYKLFQLKLLERFGEPEKLKKFVYDNLNLMPLRKKAIDQAIKQEDFAEAERLCIEGEEEAKKWPVPRKEWKALRYHIHKIAGNQQGQRNAAMELIIEGDFDYYQPLKKLTAPDDWNKTKASIIREMEEAPEVQEAYISLLIEENETGKLSSYFESRLDDVTKLYPYLLPHYKDEVKNLFAASIQASSSSAGSRNKYKSIGETIRMFGSVCGIKEAESLIGQLEEKYKHRSAFKEELKKVRKNLRKKSI
ncbi:hypothetical protein K8O68_03705 [Salipaludibacillus sp. CUR1]|uniref:hypothetical protein n=1 Tax=Salipaludibacillus sp. CUR1 TaxID=2820003 RepID=UPI001E3C132C|nr:hypothetical protein [Salipaludibacillus sp. CUR1]MCE7791530.1 hypothetical protein [Salipaludibacillus sp. CUR1]